MADRSPRPLPIAIEEIDPGWLTAALRTRAPDATVRDFEILDIDRGTCTKIRLRLELDEAGRRAGIGERVILKGGFEPHSRDMWFMHENEIQAYRDVLPTLKLPSPACHFADYDPERRQGIVVMEDLVARGVTFCNPLVPQTFDQVARRVAVLARFHAKTWNSPGFAPGGRWSWALDWLPSLRSYAERYLNAEAWRRFVASPRGAAASIRFHDLEWMSAAVERMAVLAERLPHSIVHGDTHLGNLYVDRDGTPGFFDSLPRHGPPACELAYHMTCALDTADRRRWEGALLGHYLDELGRSGIDPPGFDEAMRHYGAFLAMGYFIFLVNEPVFQPEAINTAYTARFSAAMLDHDTPGLLAGRDRD